MNAKTASIFLSSIFFLSSCAAARSGSMASAPWETPSKSLSTQDLRLLDELESKTFRYFVEQSSPQTGMTRDRSTDDSPASIAAVGFSLTAYPVAVSRGLISREKAIAYSLKTLRFLWNAPQGDEESGMAGTHGLFYHFLSLEKGERAWQCELSTIDTALLMAGILFAREYYDRGSDDEKEIRTLADSLYRRVDWNWSRGEAPRVSLGWKPESGFLPYHWGGYNEGMILYLLGLGSPTHPLPDASWAEWSKSYQTSGLGQKKHIDFGPLFGHQYSHVWVDFRAIQDTPVKALGIDYFENSRRATLAQQAYAIANPGDWKGYDSLNWGLTASDGPADKTLVIGGKPRKFLSYSARGVSHEPDDGTLAPTAALGSLPFAPEIVLPTLRHFREKRPELWGKYGFVDAFNPTFPGGASGWVDTDFLGIDQGPILLMAENFRSGLVWETMKKSPYLQRGLRRAGFSGGWLEKTR